MKKCSAACLKIAFCIAILELIYLFVHLSWMAFTQVNPFDSVDANSRNSSFITALELTFVPQSAFTEQLYLYFDLIEIFFCALLLLALIKRVKWLAYPYLLKTAIYSAVGLFYAILAIVSIMVLKGEDESTKLKESNTNIYLAIFGFVIFVYNVTLIAILLISFHKTREYEPPYKQTGNTEFYQDE
ncbi:uncharacterized protein LOC135944051 [Cloeon dipterum]|uniref:uncharacterized protein LOC135944051 n=1 Tax=Cloeon dipterum TaxID=197152 RepID=UPI00321FE148